MAHYRRMAHAFGHPPEFDNTIRRVRRRSVKAKRSFCNETQHLIDSMALAFVSTGVHITDRHSMFFRPDLESTLQPMNSSSRKRLSRRRREVSSRVRTKPNQLWVWAGARRRRTGLSRIRAVVSNCPLGVSSELNRDSRVGTSPE